MPTVPERQAVKLPDQGATASAPDGNRFRRAMMAGLMTSPQGVLGSPTAAKPKLG